MPAPIQNGSALPVNVAVVGLGFMGTTHLRACQKIESVRIAAVCGKSRFPQNGVLPEFGGNLSLSNQVVLGPEVKVHREFADVLADSAIDLVDLCVPTVLHVPYAIAALRAGKHVLCEKPMARTSEQARQIVAVAMSARGFFMPAMCLRFWPGWGLLKRIVAEKTYGEVLAARFRRVSAPPAWGQGNYFNGTESGGALFDLHIHDTDFVQFLFGRPKSVFSTGRTRWSGAIDHVVTQYQVASGAVVHAEGSWLAASGFNMSYTLQFERVTIDFDSDRGLAALQLLKPGALAQTLELPSQDGYEAEIRYFAEAIADKKAPTVVTIADGLSTVEICEAEENSVKMGTVIELPPLALP